MRSFLLFLAFISSGYLFAQQRHYTPPPFTGYDNGYPDQPPQQFYPNQQYTCLQRTEVWHKGGWAKDRNGNRIWLPGQWVFVEVPIQCPNSNNNPLPGNYPNNNQPMPINPIDFQNFMSALQAQSFDSGKQSMLGAFFKNNYVTSDQVFEIVKEFSFDSYKLDVAKMAYKSTVDPQRYYLVNKAFSFSSTSQQLDQFLQAQR